MQLSEKNQFEEISEETITINKKTLQKFLSRLEWDIRTDICPSCGGHKTETGHQRLCPLLSAIIDPKSYIEYFYEELKRYNQLKKVGLYAEIKETT